MLVSEKNKFIFIHIPKTAGSSMRALLEPFAQDFLSLNDAGKKLVSDRLRNGLSPLPPHFNLAAVSQILDIAFDEFLLITVVRNPFDRLISLYNYCKFKNQRHRLHSAANRLTLNEFIPFVVNDSGHDTACQHSYFSVPKNCKVKEIVIMRTETLQNDCKRLCEALSLPSQPLKFLNQSEKKTEEILTEENKMLIKNFEINMFNLNLY